MLTKGTHPRISERAVQTIAVTGGKGGVGKTTVAINLAAAMAERGRRVLLLDGDLGLANADVLLGIAPRYNLSHVLSGERSLDEIVLATPFGFSIAPAASGVAHLAALDASGHLALVQAFSGLGTGIDTLIVDTAAGIAPGVLRLAQASQQVLIVVCDDPASVTDAYALIKVLARDHGVRHFRILANMVRPDLDGQHLFRTVNSVAGRYLDVVLEYAGEVPDDPMLRRSIREQRPVLAAYPASKSARALKYLAERADNWPVPSGPRGHIEFFAERLVRRAAPRLEVVR
jgi:flagellar biosynthesis protein FlhG